MKKKTVPDQKKKVGKRLKEFVKFLSVPPSQGLRNSAHLATGLEDFPKHPLCWGRGCRNLSEKGDETNDSTALAHLQRSPLQAAWQSTYSCYRPASVLGSWQLFAPLPAQIKWINFTHRMTSAKQHVWVATSLLPPPSGVSSLSVSCNYFKYSSFILCLHLCTNTTTKTCNSVPFHTAPLLRKMQAVISF